jgi:hypothetical protein
MERVFGHFFTEENAEHSHPNNPPSSPHHIRGVLGNKCAGQNNLKTVHFRETLSSGNFLAWSSAILVFFCSPLSTLGRRRQAFM